MKYLHPPRSDRRRGPRYQRFLFSLAFALALLLLCIQQIPLVHAQSRAGTGPIIHWDESMIYPGQNNGNPEGPVGETAVVHGQGFTASQSLKLVLVPGDSLTNAAVCQQTNATTVAQVTADASGSFNSSFTWPASAGQVNQEYSICGLDAAAGTPVSTRDDGPFTVLSANSPTFNLSANSVPAGTNVTVSGQYWVPPQPLNIVIASCADCDPGSSNVVAVTTTSIGLTTGTFSVHILIPATMTPNNYVTNVASQAGPLDAYHITGLGIKQLTVTAPVATPTPTASPSPSATAAPTQTVAAASTPTTTTSNGSTNSGSGNGLVIGILIALAIVLLAAGGIFFFLFAQRRKQETNRNQAGNNPPNTPAGPFQANQFSVAQTPMTPFPQGQPTSTPGQFGHAAGQPNHGAYPGAPQQNQPWSGSPQGNQAGWSNSWPSNPQGNAGFNNLQQNPAQGQSNFAPNAGMGMPPMNRQCMRCGSPLVPNSSICGMCGTQNQPTADPNDPTIAY